MRNIKFSLVAIFVLTTINIKAQIPNYRYNYQMDFSIPVILGSPAYSSIFKGVYDINSSFNINSKSGVFFNLGMRYNLSKAGNTRYLAYTPLEVKNHIFEPYLSVGIQTNNGSKVLVGGNLTYGYNLSLYNKTLVDSLPGPKQHTYFSNVAANTFIRFFADQNISIGFNFGYNIYIYRFNPFKFGFDKINTAVTDQNIRNVNSYLFWGIGFSYHLKPLKQKREKEKQNK